MTGTAKTVEQTMSDHNISRAEAERVVEAVAMADTAKTERARVAAEESR